MTPDPELAKHHWVELGNAMDWFDETPPEPEPEPPMEREFNEIDRALEWVIGRDQNANPAAGCFNYENDYDSTDTVGAAVAMHYLALVAHNQPDNLEVVQKVLTCIHHFLEPGFDPPILGDYGWTVPAAAGTLALAKNTYEVWSQLSDTDKERADWLMWTFMYVGNLMHNEAHRARLNVPLWRTGNHLPNQRGYPACMNYVAAYFGGPNIVNDLLQGFNFQAHVGAFDKFGWNKNKVFWTTNPATRQLMEGEISEYTNTDSGSSANGQKITGIELGVGVKRPFAFRGVTIDLETTKRQTPNSVVPYTYVDVYHREECEFMYGSVVVNKSMVMMQNPECQGKHGWLHVPGQPYGTIGNSRYTGQVGMCYEFNADDGRSSFHYAHAGNRSSILHYCTLQELGLWRSAPETEDWLKTANHHFWEEAGPSGWVGADGQGRCGDINGEDTENNWRSGYEFGKDLHFAYIGAAT